MSEAHHQLSLSSKRNRPRPRELIFYTCIIALLLAVQFKLSCHTAKKYSPHSISKVEDIIDQPTNDYDTKKPQLSSDRHDHGEVAGERKSNQKPRVAVIDRALVNTIAPYNLINISEGDIPDNPPLSNSTWYEPNAAQYQKDIYDLQTCQPMHDWQLQSYTNCNSFHELDLTKLRYITSGTRRSAFELREVVNGRENQFVYKSVMWNNGKPFNRKRVEVQRVDALVLEKTHSSKFVPDIHGYCSFGILMDYTPDGTLYDYITGVRLAGGSTLPPVDRLRIALHITAGVAYLHSFASFYHDDLDWHQYLYIDGIFKLNDFNYAKPFYVQKNNTNERCKVTKGHMGMCKLRALEEFQARANYANFTPFRPDTMDVWMMGNLIYTVMTDLYPFEKPRNLNRIETWTRVVDGERTEIPAHIRHSHDPSYKAMINALDMCWTYSWDKRPSARYITEYLLGELRNITGEGNPDLRVVLPERNPNQNNTESDDEYFKITGSQFC